MFYLVNIIIVSFIIVYVLFYPISVMIMIMIAFLTVINVMQYYPNTISTTTIFCYISPQHVTIKTSLCQYLISSIF